MHHKRRVGLNANRPTTLMHVTTVPMTFLFLRGQLGFMRSRGMDVHVTSAPGPEIAAFAAAEGVIAHTVAMVRRITPLRDLRALWEMTRLFVRVRPDIVHASTPKGGLLGTISGRLSRVPLVIYHVRGLAYTGSAGLQRSLLRLADRVACRLAHRVLCVSNSVREELCADGLVQRNKTIVLANGSSNGVDADNRFNPDSVSTSERLALRGSLGIPFSAHVVGFVGRLVGGKGIDDLIAAFDRVCEAVPESHLLVIGGWEERDPVGHETRVQMTRNPRIHLMGEQSETAKYYSIMDVLAFPSLREGFPNVPLEAAAMEVPVVATSVTGSVDAIVQNVTGTLVPPRSPDRMADAIITYLSDNKLRSSHGKAARRRVLEKFRPADIWQALYDEYQREA